MEENIEIVKNNLERGTCWFCKKRPAVDKAAIEVKMHGDVTRTPTWQGTHMEWQHVTLEVPRCKQCKSAHVHTTALRVIGVVMGIIFGLISCTATDNAGAGIGILAVCIGLGFGIPALTKPAGMKSDNDYKEFPDIKKLLSQGWEFGEKPPDAQ